MSYFVRKKDVDGVQMEGHISYPMLTEAQGCVAGFSSGITIYTASEYPTTDVHNDQEGFVVLEGTGWAKVGENPHFSLQNRISILPQLLCQTNV